MNAVSIRNPKSEIRNRQGRWFLVQIKEIVDFEEELAGELHFGSTVKCLRVDDDTHDNQHEGQQLKKERSLASGQCTIKKKSWTMGINKQASPHSTLSRKAATRNQIPPTAKMTTPTTISKMAMRSMDGMVLIFTGRVNKRRCLRTATIAPTLG